MSEPPLPPARRPNGISAVAGDVVDALRTSPVLLLIVLLNMAFAGGAAYYLVRVEDYRAQDRTALLHATVVATSDDRSIDDEHRADRNAAFGQPLSCFIECRLKERIHSPAIPIATL